MFREKPFKNQRKRKEKHNKKFFAVVEQDDFVKGKSLIKMYQIFAIKPYIFICPIKRI